MDGETGFLIDPEKPITEWVTILSRVAKDPKLVRRMGENLHQLTEENFDMNKVAIKRLELYEELLNVSP